MRLTTIGTGTATPSAQRVNAGHLVEAGAVRLLLDCGSGVVHRMAGIGADWLGITHIALTHFHPDHTLDLTTLFYAWKYGTLPPRSAPLELIGPPGTLALVQSLAELFGGALSAPSWPLTVRELPFGGGVELGDGVRLDCLKVPHSEESVAYSIGRGGRRIVFTGDTGESDSLADWARGCDVLLAECSLPDAMAIPTHLTPLRCAALAERAAPAMLALTHFYSVVEREDITGAVATRYGGPVTLTVDGWFTEIEDT
jgi:ribonuclease BN (tRNA processing enzyme)